MRVAREDKALDTQFHIFQHSFGNCRRVADQRGTGAATDQANARPQIGADFEFIAPSPMQRLHPMLTNGLRTTELTLSRGNCLIIQMFDEVVGCCPCFTCCFAHNDMQSNAKAHRAPGFSRIAPDIGDLFGHLLRRFALGQVKISLARRRAMGSIGRTAKVDGWEGLLDRGKDIAALDDLEVFALKGVFIGAAQ